MPDNQPETIPFATAKSESTSGSAEDNNAPENNNASEYPSPTEDIVDVPADRLHNSDTTTTVLGIAIAFVVTLVGAIGLGAGYGAFIALCGEKYVNITAACAFPFTMNLPSQLGFLWGHLQDEKWRSPISLLGFVACFYSVCVGWLAGVLDGPGLVFNPLTLAGHLFDSSNYSLWIASWRQDIGSLSPFILTLRGGELSWMFIGGYFSRNADTPYPYCQNCNRWMNNETQIRLKYDPPSTAEAQNLATGLVTEQYIALYDLQETIGPKEKGLQLSVYSCDKCDANPVLDATWYRPTPDPNKKEVEQMLESGTGTRLFRHLIVTPDVRTYIEHLAEATEASDEKATKKAA